MPQHEHEIILGLLNEVERDSASSQRVIAKRLGIALGLANACLNRCVKKGFVKVREAPANRYLYYLTPSGFTEKARLSAEYLTQSFGFFRTARRQCEDLLDRAIAHGQNRLVLAGSSDLAEILVLCSQGRPVTLVGVLKAQNEEDRDLHLPMVNHYRDLPDHDAVVVTALVAVQDMIDQLVIFTSPNRILVPDLLKVAVRPSPFPEGENA